MTTGTITLAEVPWTHDDPRNLLRQMDAEVGPRYADLRAIRGPRPQLDPATIQVTYVAYDDGLPVATASLRFVHGFHEVKRVFVAPSHRRLGLASRLLDAVGDWAKAAGVSTLVLQTGVRQPDAVALYARKGWQAIEPFGDYVGDEYSLCYRKEIA